MAKIKSDLCTLTIGGELIARIKDVERNCTADENDETTRETAQYGWKETRAGLRSWDCAFEITRDSTDPAYAVLKAAFLARTELVAVFNDTASDIFTGACEVVECSRSEPIGGTVKIKLKVVGCGVPTWA